MRLKRLEVYGFKSFADKTVIEFEKGITGIVGPNGSGKSNLSDAVRWVLGEQSAKSLRGGRMEDVIFGGTQTRRRLGYCEVSLVFDNEDRALPIDFTEVVITRRAYRSGEGEYFINRAACRMKDILELFRDTGIGKDGYSIVGQGRIDAILSQKSEDRRSVFDEAAGIVKYRVRIEESEKRFAAMRENLVRIEDLIGELESRLEPLAKASETARRYLAMRDELRVLECSAFIWRWDQGKARMDTLRSMADDLKAQIEAEEAEIAKLAAGRDEKNAALQEAEGGITAAHEQLIALTREAEVARGRATLLASELSGLEKEAAELREAIGGAGERLSGIRAEQEENQKAQAACDGKIASLETETGEAQARVNACRDAVTDAEARYEAHQGAVIRAMNRMTDVKSAQARLGVMKQQLDQREADAKKDRAEIEDDAGGIQEQIAEAKEKERALAGAQAEAAAAAEGLSARLDEKTKEIDGLFSALDRLNVERSQKESRLHVLQDMVRDYAGYQQSVKKVLLNAKGDPRVFGIVADLLRVPKELERAVEAALAGAMQNVVVRDEYTARDMIAYLRENSFGRATFLPLSAVRSRLLQEHERAAIADPGLVGVASEMVSFDERFRGVMENLLGRTVIAKDLDAGIRIMRRCNHAFRLVTLAGDVMHPGGSMTGGSSASRMTSLLSRDREIGEHTRQIAALAEEIAKTRSGIETCRAEKADLNGQLSDLRAGIQEGQISLSLVRERAGALAGRQEELRTRAEQTDELLREIAVRRKDVEEQMARLLDDGGDGDASGEEMHRRSRELADALSARRGELEAAQDALQRLQLSLAEARKDREALSAASRRLEDERLQTIAKAAESENRLQTVTLSHQETTVRKQEALRRSEELETRQGAAREDLDGLTRNRDALSSEITNATERIDGMRANLTGVTDRLHRAEISLERLESELRQGEQRIWDEYELTYAGASEYDSRDYQSARDDPRIASLRREMKSIGPVNFSATEEYRTCKERYEDLTAQRDDIVRAQEDLTRVVEAVRKEMELRFFTNFHLMQEYLQEAFSRLFGGGKAELQLTDANDVLGSGIEIVAQPPGKKLQLLSLLSGGERALTAIAILFAMLKVKPTPFCFLDEIEAALDDGNIETFAQYLKSFSRQTQFVIVTHRKGTMEHCDSLYGISMEEKGISKLVSVELKDIDESDL